MIGENAATGSLLKRQALRALPRLNSEGSAGMNPPVRAVLLTPYMIEGDELRRRIQLIRNLAVDRCNAIENGMVREHGDQGGTDLAEFSGRQRDEHP